MVRVVVADDSLLVREGIEHLLAGEEELVLVASCADRLALLEAVEREHPDVIVTDIRMPPSLGDEGIEIANQLRRTHPEIGVLVLSQYVDVGYLLALLDGGSAARGYLLKDTLVDRKHFVDAIHEIAAGGSVIDPKVVDALVVARGSKDESPLRLLTPREHEVLAELASGKSNAAIARSLVISKRAVEHHISSIFAKLDLSEEAEMSRRVTATLLFLADKPTVLRSS